MEEQKPKKEVSTLSFSDFQSAGIAFNHDREDLFEAMGIEKEEAEEMKNIMIERTKGANKLTEAIELTLSADVPTRWKIVGLFKIGEAAQAQRTVKAIMAVPDGLPAPLMKISLMMEAMGLGGIHEKK